MEKKIFSFELISNDGRARLGKIITSHGSIKTPTLILASRVDGITPPAAQETLNNNLPNSNLIWFENVGHNMKLEIPDQLSNVCVNFMNNNDAN